MRGEGRKNVCFCPLLGNKSCPHRRAEVKKWQNSVHVVVECPLTYWRSQVKNGMNQHGETNNNQWKKFSMMYSRFRGTRKYCSATKVSNNQNYFSVIKRIEMFNSKLKFVALKYSEKIRKYSTQISKLNLFMNRICKILNSNLNVNHIKNFLL